MPNPSVIHTQLSEPKLTKLTNVTGKDRFIRDTDLRGFGIRISPRNVKSFFVEATVQGKFVRRVIGQYPLKPLSEARKTALETLRDLRYGSALPNGSAEKSVPLSDLARAFLLDRQAVLRASTMRDYRSILLGIYFKPWHTRSVIEIKKLEVLERYRVLCTNHGVPTANRAMRVLSALFNYGSATRPELEAWGSPVRVLAQARAKRPVRPRTSYIPLDQLGTWLEALDRYKAEGRPQESSARREDVWLLLHLLLMTGLRSGEARSLRWSDVDLDSATVTIRSEVAKNHREAVLPLNHWLVAQLRNRYCEGQRFVFRARSKARYIDNLRRPLEEIHERSGLRITPHDLRRTYATYLDVIGAPFGVIKQLLNHVSGSDITAQYVQNRGVDELRVYVERVFSLIESRRTANVIGYRCIS